MIKQVFGVFALNDAVNGFDSGGAIYDNFSFTVSFIKGFESIDEASEYAEFQMQERINRGIDTSRFVILPILHSQNDPIFNQ